MFLLMALAEIAYFPCLTTLCGNFRLLPLMFSILFIFECFAFIDKVSENQMTIRCPLKLIHLIITSNLTLQTVSHGVG